MRRPTLLRYAAVLAVLSLGAFVGTTCARAARTLPPANGAARQASVGTQQNSPVLLAQAGARPAEPPSFRSGYRARVTVLSARAVSGDLPDSLPVGLAFNPIASQKLPLGNLKVGEPSRWADLEPYLKGQRRAVIAHATVEKPVLSSFRCRIEIDEGRGAPTTLDEESENNWVMFLLPGYSQDLTAAPRSRVNGVEPPRENGIEPAREHVQRYLDAARAVAVRPEDRARQFTINAYQLIGGMGDRKQLEIEAEALANLGFNTVNTYGWRGIRPEEIDQVLQQHGLRKRSMAVYSPPSYFDFDVEKMSPEALDKWARPAVERIRKDNGGSFEDIADYKLSDEPNWYFPAVFKQLRAAPGGLEGFRKYLQDQGLQPRELGAGDWSGVSPIGGSQAVDLPSRRLFYWTTRYFAEAGARGHKLAAEALSRAAGRDLHVEINWNNWISRWYQPSPNEKIGNNPEVGPDSAMGSFDWMRTGRLGTFTLWTEDWQLDQEAQTWSLYGDVLRSATAPGSGEWGGYVVGKTIGGVPDGTSYKILSMIGHGAKQFDLYTFGPDLFFPGNCWSEQFELYRPISDALRLVGRGERLLYPGKAARGKVAILLSGNSTLWNKGRLRPLYAQELWGLHAALVHAGYSVDFVDEQGLEGGSLSKSGYTTLYVTEQNVGADAQASIRDWVRGGGTLVATPGAATADEYNTPTTSMMDAVLGLRGRTSERTIAAAPNGYSRQPVTDTLTPTDASLGSGAVEVHGPVTPLQPGQAETVARLRSGGAGVTMNRFGSGRAYAYAFYPGWQYWISPDRSDVHHLPRDWSAPARALITAPVKAAGTPRPVTAGQAGVEVCRLESGRGIALVLLNWTDSPISDLSLTVPNAARFDHVTSLRSGAVSAQLAGDTVKLRVPLKTVDVLLME